MATLTEIIAEINAEIVANGNQEITANVLRPILLDMINQPNELIGDLEDLTTTANTNLVDAINEINSGGAFVQNNIPKTYGIFGISGTGALTEAEVAAYLNEQFPEITISETDTPVIFFFNKNNFRYVYFFAKGQGTWSDFDPEDFILVSAYNIITTGIIDVPNTQIINIDPITTTYIDKANEGTYDFSDSGELNSEGYARTYYFSFTQNGKLYYAMFIGDPQESPYGSGGTAFQESDFILIPENNNPMGVQSVTGDLVDNTDPLNPVIGTPTLEEVVAEGGNIGTSLLDNDGDGTSPYITEETVTDLLEDKADLVDGKVPQSQLPAYVDDVLEFDTLGDFPVTGEAGKIYIAKDTNLAYRWTGSGYAEISQGLALGETSATAYRGDRGKTAYDHSQTIGNPHGTQIGDMSGLQTSLDSKLATSSPAGGITSGNVTDWNKAFTDYVSRKQSAPVVSETFGGDMNTMNMGTYMTYMSTTATNKPFLQVGGLISVGSATVGFQILGSRIGNEFWYRPFNSGYGAWVKIWSSSDFTSTNISNWNTAFGWGNHAGLYLKLLGSVLTNATGEVVTIDGSGNIHKRTAAEIRQDGGISDSSLTEYDEAYTHSQTTGNPHNTEMNDIPGLTEEINTIISDITSIALSLESLAPLDSPEFTGTPTAPTPTAGDNDTSIATTAFVQGALTTSRPYRVYTAILKQISTNAPTPTVLENTLGFTPSWSYVSTGYYKLNETGGFPNGRTICFISMGTPAVGAASHDIRWFRSNDDEISVQTLANGVLTNADLNDASFELRIYNE